jgi:hypothetical protein
MSSFSWHLSYSQGQQGPECRPEKVEGRHIVLFITNKGQGCILPSTFDISRLEYQDLTPRPWFSFMVPRWSSHLLGSSREQRDPRRICRESIYTHISTILRHANFKHGTVIALKLSHILHCCNRSFVHGNVTMGERGIHWKCQPPSERFTPASDELTAPSCPHVAANIAGENKGLMCALITNARFVRVHFSSRA